jgi:hypothetical protein
MAKVWELKAFYFTLLVQWRFKFNLARWEKLWERFEIECQMYSSRLDACEESIDEEEGGIEGLCFRSNRKLAAARHRLCDLKRILLMLLVH